MRRRGLLALLGAGLVAPLVGAAQPLAKPRKIGWLSPGMRSNKSALQNAFLKGLRDFGYTIGQDVVIEQRDAEGRVERLPDMAAELVRLGVDVIVTTEGVPGVRAAQGATRSIPIVMIDTGDPVGTGLVASLARPGGNVTGMSLGGDLPEKRLQLLKEMAPAASRVIAPYNPAFPANLEWIERAHGSAAAFGLTLLPIEIRTPEELRDGFATAINAGGDSLITFGDPFTSNRQAQILALAVKHRLAAMHVLREFVEAGGLASLGADQIGVHRRAAIYVDKLFKGAKPGELPVEQPTNVELVINTGTAKLLGLTLPPSLLLRADEVIE